MKPMQPKVIVPCDAIPWNRCDVCGRFIDLKDFDSGRAVRRLLTPDSEFTREEYETLCKKHRKR